MRSETLSPGDHAAAPRGSAMAASAVPKVSAGRMIAPGASAPLTGVQPSQSENTRISNGPSQKLGIEIPSSDKLMALASSALPR